MALGGVEGGGDVIGQRAGGLGLGAHGQQHAPDVRVAVDGNGFIGSIKCLALFAFGGIIPGVLIGALGDADAFQPDGQPRVVHHREHVFNPPVFLADQVCFGAAVVAEGHDAGGAGVDPHLMFERHAPEVVAVAQGAVVLDQELRHHEQRQPLDAVRAVRRAGEHHVDDVFGEVVFAVGVEDFLAGNQVTLAFPDRLGPDLGQIGAGLGLSQVHGPGPHAGHQFFHENRLEAVGTVHRQKLHRRLGQRRAQRQGHVGGMPDFINRRRHQIGQPLAAVIGIEGDAIPTAFDELDVGFGKTLRRADNAVFQLAALDVAGPVERRQDFGAQLASLFQDRVHQVGEYLLETRQLGDGVEVRQLVQNEPHVVQGRPVFGHRQLFPPDGSQ